MNIQNLLTQILSARYGKDVRQSIHDAIRQCYYDGKTGATDLVAREQIDKLEIQSTTDTTLDGSVAGGYKLLSMSGKSVQNGTPTPDAPQSIHNVGDCVEMIRGYYNNDQISVVDNALCNKHLIPCSGGDVLKYESENILRFVLQFYDSNGVCYSPSNGIASGTSGEYTIPSGASYFTFYVNKYVDGTRVNVTPDTAGKILLTINGKYVVQIVESGKNLLKCDAKTSTVKGVTFTVKDDGSIATSGTSNGTYANFDVAKMDVKAGESYTFSGISGGNDSTYRIYIATNNSAFGGSGFSLTNSEITKTATVDDTITFRLQIVPNGYNANATFYPMIRKADITDATYEPYKEKVATVLLDAPLRDTDVMGNKEVVRKRASVVFDGSSDENIGMGTSADGIRYFYDSNAVANGVISGVNILCTHYSNNGQAFFADKNIFLSTGGAIIICDNDFASAGEFKTWLQSNPITVEYALATPIVETLDSTSQIALNSLETFDSVTYINVDSRTQPKGIKGEYGTSKVGARTIKNELRNDTLEIKYNELAVALVATESGV